MKNYIYVIVAVLLFTVTIAGCAPKEAEVEGSLAITEYEPAFANGNGESPWIGDISELLLVNEDTILPSSLQVYKDKYPYNYGGPTFTIDQSLRDMVTVKLTDFLETHCGEKGVSADDLKQGDNLEYVKYESENTRIMAWPEYLSISTDELVDDVLSGNFFENKWVQIALEYMGIENPKVTSYISYNSKSGEPDTYEYTITETSDDFLENLQNSKFSNIRMSYFYGSDTVHFGMTQIDASDIVSDEPIVTYKEVMKYIQSEYGVSDAEKIKVTVEYVTDYETGCFLPMYKVYIQLDEAPEGMPEVNVEGVNTYKIVQIPMSRSSHMVKAAGESGTEDEAEAEDEVKTEDEAEAEQAEEERIISQETIPGEKPYTVTIVQIQLPQQLSTAAQKAAPQEVFATGYFDVVTSLDGAETGRFTLNSFFEEKEMSCKEPFPIVFEDYNNDGDYEFVISQAAGDDSDDLQYLMLGISADDGSPYHISAKGYKKDGYIYNARENMPGFTKLAQGSIGIAVTVAGEGRQIEGRYIWDEKSTEFIFEAVQ